MDRITKSQMNDFQASQGLSLTMAESAVFERFANYAVLSREYSDSFNVEDVSIGSDSQVGIDGLAILVNGALVTSPEEVDDLAQRNGYIDARFVFVQAKTSANFDAGAIGTFGFAVQDFFNEKGTLPRTPALQSLADVKESILSKGALFSKGNPACRLYYVTTGQWNADQVLVARATAVENDLQSLQLFSDVRFTPVDAQALQRLYQSTQSRVAAEFQFPHRVVLPEIAGISQAYLGLLKAADYLTIVKDESGSIRQSLFYDNVRDFQDYNEVNLDIKRTLDSPAQDRFAVLNNGVTIVAKELGIVGNQFRIEDYQIVNGCQTSHVLYDQENAIGDGVYVPVKIIETADDEVMNSIITATNRQTQVKPEQLNALSSFQKNLEKYFATFPEKQRLYYERRSRQYAKQTVEKVRIITPNQQIRAFASMFLNEPHRASRYYSELVGLVGGRIFGEDHRLEPYYTSAFALYKLEFLFRNFQLGQQYKPARYHLLLTLRYQIAGSDMPAIGANKMETYCEPILKVLWDEASCSAVFAQASKVIDAVVGKGEVDRDRVKTQSFTDQVLAALGHPRPRSPAG
jgi:hypothetical protein